MRPNSPPQSTSVSSSRPRAFRSLSRPAIGLSTSSAFRATPFQSAVLVPLVACARPARTGPRARRSRRASRHCRPKFASRSLVEAIEPLRRRRSRSRCPGSPARRFASGRPARRTRSGLPAPVGPGLLQVVAIHLLDQVEVQTLQSVRCGRVRDERDLRPVGADPGRADRRTLIDRRQERRAPVVHAAVAEVRADGDVSREVLVLGPEPVRDPGPHARPDERIAAGVEFQQRSPVPRVRPVHRVDHAEVVHAAGQMGEQLADRDPALAVPLETEWRPEQVPGLARHDARLGERQGLPWSRSRSGL